MGTEDECTDLLDVLRRLPELDILDVARYPNRPPSKLIRLYVEARITREGQR